MGMVFTLFLLRNTHTHTRVLLLLCLWDIKGECEVILRRWTAEAFMTSTERMSLLSAVALVQIFLYSWVSIIQWAPLLNKLLVSGSSRSQLVFGQTTDTEYILEPWIFWSLIPAVSLCSVRSVSLCLLWAQFSGWGSHCGKVARSLALQQNVTGLLCLEPWSYCGNGTSVTLMCSRCLGYSNTVLLK